MRTKTRPHNAATSWRQFALAATQLGTRGVTAASAIRSSNSWEAVEGFGKKRRKFESGGDGYLNDAVEAVGIAVAQAAAPVTFRLSGLGGVGAV